MSLRPERTAFSREFLEFTLEGNDICAWFQPKWDLASGRIVGAEALARWYHPDHGVLGPGVFLADVRNHGLEYELLVRILDDVVAAQNAWRRRGHLLTVSVNLPTALLSNADLGDRLFERVNMRGGDVHAVGFELLETGSTPTAEDYVRGATRLRELGFGLALDDFGRGYGSLFNLISAPFTELKIDRAFVDGVADDALKRVALISAAHLGRSLGLKVTAEGVERAEDLATLRHAGCHYGQGFLCAPPMDMRDFDVLLNDPDCRGLPTV